MTRGGLLLRRSLGKLARGAAVGVDTVRYYEKERLLAPARRTAAGYRLYGPDALRRLRFIRHAQQCGFSLDEILELLELRARNRSCCKDVRAVAIAKRALIESKIKALRELSLALGNLIDVCVNGAATLDACPILGALETARAGTRASKPSDGGRKRPLASRSRVAVTPLSSGDA